MSENDAKMPLYINMTWLKAFLKMILTILIPYNIVVLVLWKFSVIADPTFHALSIWVTIAIGLTWAVIYKLKAAKKSV